MITHTHKGVRHRLFTCPNTCELGDAEATPVALDVSRTHKEGTLSPLGVQARTSHTYADTTLTPNKGKPVGRIGTMPGMPAPPSTHTEISVGYGTPPPLPRPPRNHECDHNVSLDEHCAECDRLHPLRAPEQVTKQADLSVVQHEVNKHLRTFLALSPEHRMLVANVALALRRGVGE